MPVRTGSETVVEQGGPLHGRGWELYLIASAALIAIVVPGGPGQSALVDVVNLIALVAFTGALVARGVPLTLPFLGPIVVIAAGSLLAMTNARSLSAGALAMLQDAYLYAWFAMLVALMCRRGDDLFRVRVAWVIAADLVAVYSMALMALGHSPGIGVSTSWRDLLPSSDFRPSATFQNANQFGSYLMVTAFVLVGLIGRLRARWLLLSAVLLGMALMTTKSNGSIIAMTAGLAAWAMVRGIDRGPSAAGMFGLASLAVALVILLGWAHSEWGVGTGMIHEVQRKSFVGRLAKSSGSREHIWRLLERSYEQSPLGIGPGNSVLQVVPIGDRLRGNETDFQSKEAHSDYLAYAVERGPIGVLGLLAFLGAAFARVLRGRKRVAWRAPGPEAAALWASLVGVLVAVSVHALVIESLHFRHVWFALAIACALTARREAEATRPVLTLAPSRPRAPATPAAVPIRWAP